MYYLTKTLLGVLTILAVTFSFHNITLAQDTTEEDLQELTVEEQIQMVEESPDIPEDIKVQLIEIIKNPPEEVDETNLSQVNCTDYYTFQSVQVSLGTNLDMYVPGDSVVLTGVLINENPYPVVDGNVFARVARKNENYTTEGNYIVDELLLEENVALKENETKEVVYQWNIPNTLAQGDYKIDYFFSVGKKFNLGGLPFSNEVVIGSSEFSIDTENTSYISFDRSETVVNDQPYKHIGNWPVVQPNESVTITQPLVNTYRESKDVVVTYNLYHWDSLDQTDLRDTKTETVTLGAQETETLTYTIPQMNDAVYYLQIVAQSGTDKTIVNIRVVSPQENIRLNYPAITKFPVNQGDNVTLFSCFHNGSSMNTKGKVQVTLEDKAGNTVGSFAYEGDVTAGMLAEKAEITAQDNYEYLTLTAKTYDKNNSLTDEYTVVYDCSDFDSCGAVEETTGTTPTNSAQMNPVSTSLLVVVLLIVLLVVMVVMIKRRKHELVHKEVRDSEVNNQESNNVTNG